MWNLIDTTGFIQIGWEYDPEVYREKKTDEMTMDEFLEKYGEPVMTDNDKDADAFCRQMEELKSTITNEALRKDFELVSANFLEVIKRLPSSIKIMLFAVSSICLSQSSLSIVLHARLQERNTPLSAPYLL